MFTAEIVTFVENYFMLVFRLERDYSSASEQDWGPVKIQRAVADLR